MYAAVALLAVLSAAAKPESIPLPGGQEGIGFDDFQLAPQAVSPTPSRVRGLPPSRAKAARGKPARVAHTRRSR